MSERGQPDVAFIRDRWIPALRGGTYRQGSRALHQGDTFCCLGVAVDLLMQAGEMPGWTDDPENGEAVIPLADGSVESGFLPPAVAARLGLAHDGGHLDGEGWEIGGRRYVSLADANDDGATFAEIADTLDVWCDELTASGTE